MQTIACISVDKGTDLGGITNVHVCAVPQNRPDDAKRLVAPLWEVQTDLDGKVTSIPEHILDRMTTANSAFCMHAHYA